MIKFPNKKIINKKKHTSGLDMCSFILFFIQIRITNASVLISVFHQDQRRIQ
jgi:hypothetical protein